MIVCIKVSQYLYLSPLRNSNLKKKAAIEPNYHIGISRLNLIIEIEPFFAKIEPNWTELKYFSFDQFNNRIIKLYLKNTSLFNYLIKIIPYFNKHNHIKIFLYI